MRISRLSPVLSGLLIATFACSPGAADQTTPESTPATSAAPATGGQASVVDDESQKDVVKVAAASKDHTTLVAAVQAADLTNSLANAGPFTVFAPTNAAFDALPEGTVDDLLKPANKDRLAGILQHHVTVPVFDEGSLTDGTELAMADGGKVKVTVKDGATWVGDAKITGSVRASNGIVYIVDKVILP